MGEGGRRGKKIMERFRTKRLWLLIALATFFWSLQEARGQDLGNIAFVDNVNFDANGYHSNPDYNGQCVTYVKNARTELNFIFGNGYKGKSITDERIENARNAGFEVNGIPRVGAAFLENVKTSSGGFVAHTGLITDVKLTEKDGKYVYVVSIKESNRQNDLKMGTREIELPDTGWYFIHEKKGVYNEKKEKALEQVTKVYKNLGKEPNDEEKKELADKLLSGGVSLEQITAVIDKKPTDERTAKIEKLRREAEEARTEAERLASPKGLFKETIKGIPKAVRDLEKGEFKGTFPQAMYDISTLYLEVWAKMHGYFVYRPYRWPGTLLAPTDTIHSADDKKIFETVKAAEDIARRLAKTKVDVFFLSDNTGSMSGLIASAKDNALTILNKLAGEDSRFEKIDVRWGVGRYYGDPTESGEAPTTAYRLQQVMTTDKTAIQDAINQWSASGGGDWEEANFFAIQQAATEGAGTPRDGTKATNQKTGWRSDAAKVIVVFGDAPSWQKSVNEKELRQVLQDKGVHVVFIDTSSINNAGSDPVAWDAITGTQIKGAAEELADGSSGSYIPLTDSSKIVEAVLDGVYDAITDNTWAGGQMARIDSSKIWRSRTASSITGESSNNRNNWDFTLRYPGQTASTFSFNTDGATLVSDKRYYKKSMIGGGTNIFGKDMSLNSLVQFTSDKDFFRFVMRNNSSSFDSNPDNNTARVEAYFGHKTAKAKLPSSGIDVYDLSMTTVSPYENKYVHTSGEDLPIQMSVNWQTGKVYAVGSTDIAQRSGIALFLGSVDRDKSIIEGDFTYKSARIKTSEESSIPRFIKDTDRGNTYVQIYGENEPVGMGGTFSVDWYDENKSSSLGHMITSGFLDEKNVSYTSVSNNEVWKGFAVGFVHNRNDGSLTIATNDSSNDVQMTLKPSTGEFAGQISTSDGTNTYSLSSSTSDKNVYVSPQAFGATKDLNGVPAYIATERHALSNYNYMTWGHWSYDTGTSPDKTVFMASPWIAGRLTPSSDIPTTGTATYNGGVTGQLKEAGGLFTSVGGTSTLTANFGSKGITGSFDNLKRYDNSTWVTSAAVNANWGAGTNAISGTIAGEGKNGNINGAFFGPSAQEIGGNWTLNGGGDKAAGIFGGKK